MAVLDRFKNAWNAFTSRDPTDSFPLENYYGGYSYRPRYFRSGKNEVRSIIDSIYNRIAVDISSININHVQLNKDYRYEDTIRDSLNRVLTTEANIDQTGRNLIREAALIMFDYGSVAIVPIDTDVDPKNTDSYKIYSVRAAKIVGWYPREIMVEIYNDRTGIIETMKVEKRISVIVENPFYNIMNESNSVVQRLLRTQRYLDDYNEQSTSDKLNMFIQVPYSIKTKAMEKMAENRLKSIEFQLTQSKRGIAYVDGTEKIIQLNRSLENNLWTQAKELEDRLYNQMGFSQAIFDGTADEKTTLNYRNQTLEPVLNDFVEEMERKWLSRTAQTQRQAIRYFSDPFKLVPAAQIAEIGDKYTRNEIMTSNELRSVMGMKPSNDPNADKLRNSNLNHPDERLEVQNNIQNKEGEKASEK